MADVAPQISHEEYWSRAYNTKERFVSFWHQLDEVLSFGGQTVLEIGPGSGIVTDLLRRAGQDVTTVDFDPAVGADLTASVTSLDLPDGGFDVVLCSQVLEHLPWDDAVTAMGELARVARVGVVVSVPDVSPYAGKSFPIYYGLWISEVRRRMPTSRVELLRQIFRRRMRIRDFLFVRFVPASWGLGGRAFEWKRAPIPHVAEPAVFDGQHYWEIGRAGFSAETIAAALANGGLTDVRSFRVPENPWHHFFVGRRG